MRKQVTGWEKIFSKEYIIKDCSVAIIHKSTHKCCRGCGEKGTLVHCCWECGLLQTPLKTVWNLLKKTKNKTVFWPRYPTAGNIPKEFRNNNSEAVEQPHVHSSTIFNSQNLETTLVPISKWADRKAVVHLHNGILHSRKKEGTPTFCNSMDETEDYYAKWNKPIGERQIPYDLPYKRNPMNKINWQAK